jgi:hypothetical protein
MSKVYRWCQGNVRKLLRVILSGKTRTVRTIKLLVFSLLLIYVGGALLLWIEPFLGAFFFQFLFPAIGRFLHYALILHWRELGRALLVLVLLGVLALWAWETAKGK